MKWRDLASVFPMAAALLAVPFKRKKYADTWLIGEADDEARDNGYHFFRYMRSEHPEQPCIYFISKDAHDWPKVAPLGPTVKTGSVRHWLLYFTCRWTISSQKGGKPNAALCNFLELNQLIKPRFVFLQHGVTKDKNDWLMADRCRFTYLITATTSEQAFVSKAFGYPDGVVHLTGFPRFDNLHDNRTIPNRVIIMPTWRTWLRNKSSKGVTGESDIEHSRFMMCWLELLNSPELERIARAYHLEILFYPHRGLQPHLASFRVTNPMVRVVASEEVDIQDVLKSAVLMITDWSSVYFDMFYMKKPVIFYQFDEQEFRSYHYEQGWFDYHHNPFSTSLAEPAQVLRTLEEAAAGGFAVSDSFLAAHAKEFQPFDNRNSQRVYELLSGKTEAERGDGR
ncbi:MAG: CDP-glycerol glycerophosphotransferase family protein [Clostridia bacterium]|nr:CDP-glycerol glycerophosphotransferase family protein [Clostridia bacterium]